MTSQDFLKKYLDYKCNWSHLFGQNVGPVRVREEQLLALMRAFKIAPTVITNNLEDLITDFENGRFLELDHDPIENKAFDKKISDFIDEFFPSDFSIDAYKRRGAYQGIFVSLLRFRVEIDNFKKPSHIRFEGVGPLDLNFVAYHKAKVFESLDNGLIDIDEILCLMIDPDKNDFDKELLIEQYNYPTASLSNIDLEWLEDSF